jgi:DNA-directed RNA polymerase subunit RPC12/RpoP
MTDRYPDVDREMTCPDCGGTAHLMTPLPDDDDLYPGDVLAYRCSSCGDRWDVVYETTED